MTPPAKKQTLAEHIDELRARLFWAVIVVVVFCAVGYWLHNLLFSVLERPLHQQLYYTSPIGGFNAIVKISVLAGLVAGTPFLIYQICQFVSPALKVSSSKRPIKIFVSSVVLAIAGICFGYFVSLPASLHFLTHIGAKGLQPLIIVNDYLNFVFSYLLGFAVLFQLPLIISFFNNRMGPLSPKRLMSYQRWVILISFILAAILTPTPDPVNQFIMALPIILLYQFSIAIVWLQNRKMPTTKVMTEDLVPAPIKVNPASNVVHKPVKPHPVFMDIIPPATAKSA